MSSAINDKQVKKVSGSLKKGDVMYCPSHGVTLVMGSEKRKCLDVEMEFYNLFFEKEKMNILIPVSKIKELGIRPLSTKDVVMKIINIILKKAPKIGKGIWTKRIIECETKLYSGSIVLIAEIVRDLFLGTKDPNRSYSERLIYEKALARLTSEVAVVLKVPEEEAHKMIIDSLLIANPDLQKVAAVVDDILSDSGDFDDDIEDMDEDDDDTEETVAEKKSKKKVA